MLWIILVSLTASAGEVKLSGSASVGFRRLFSVCESHDAKCAAGKCKITVSNLTCERVPGGMKGNCTFRCNGAEHMLTGDQALTVFKSLEGQKRMIEKSEKNEAFKEVSVNCEPGVCTVKHSKIK